MEQRDSKGSLTYPCRVSFVNWSSFQATIHALIFLVNWFVFQTKLHLLMGFAVHHLPEGLDYCLEDRQTIAHVVQANCLAAPLSANRR